MEAITDSLGRTFRTLRVSLTDVCNMACTYCTTGRQGGSVKNAMSVEAFSRVILKLHAVLDFSTIRFTGGEPMLYPGLIPLIHNIRQGNANVKIKLTTNGYLLSDNAEGLLNAGINSINVSLDALQEDTYFNMTRIKSVSKVLQAVEKCTALGIPVKINSVIMKGVNEQEMIPLLRYAKGLNIPIRFLELMKMGHLYSSEQAYFFSASDMLHLVEKMGVPFRKKGREKHGTACYWEMQDGYRFGIIANESMPFCTDCNRLRLDSYGNVFGCLSSNQPVKVLPFLDDNSLLIACLKEALSQKRMRFSGSALSMKTIGG